MKICKICGKTFDDDHEGTIVNAGTKNEFFVCDSCTPSECDNGRIISCEACGEYFSPDMLHTEEIEGFSFTPCPSCGLDMIDCMTRSEFEDEHTCYRYSVIVTAANGNRRGYIVSVNSGEGVPEVIKRLSEKVNLTGATNIAVAEILLKEDEF